VHAHGGEVRIQVAPSRLAQHELPLQCVCVCVFGVCVCVYVCVCACVLEI